MQMGTAWLLMNDYVTGVFSSQGLRMNSLTPVPETTPRTVMLSQAKHLQKYSGTSLQRGPWDHENYLVISGFSLYQG